MHHIPSARFFKLSFTSLLCSLTLALELSLHAPLLASSLSRALNWALTFSFHSQGGTLFDRSLGIPTQECLFHPYSMQKHSKHFGILKCWNSRSQASLASCLELKELVLCSKRVAHLKSSSLHRSACVAGANYKKYRVLQGEGRVREGDT